MCDLVYAVTGGVWVDVLQPEHRPVHPSGGSARAVEVSSVVREAARPEVAGGTAGDGEEEGNEGVESQAEPGHQPLPARAAQLQQGPGLLGVLAGQEEGLGQSHH